MNIGVIGSGNIGGTLGRLWAAAGHRVLFSSRHPERLTDLVRQAGPNARAGSVADAIQFGETVMEAVPFGKIRDLPVKLLSGKIVLSATNYYPSRDGKIDLHGLSQSEYVAKHALPGVRLVKAFNMMRAGVMEGLADGRETRKLCVFIASDDAEAKQAAAQLVTDAKFVSMDVGSLAEGRLFESGGPLYDTQLTPEEARDALTRARAK